MIIIVLSFNHCSFDQLKMSNHSLTAWGIDPPFSHKSVVSITHEQNIINFAAKHLFVGSYLQVTWWALGQ